MVWHLQWVGHLNFISSNWVKGRFLRAEGYPLVLGITIVIPQRPLNFSVIFFTTDFNICPTREITASDGMIISPNYPQKYPPNTDCSLTIKQPLNRRIYFTFLDLNLTNGKYMVNNDNNRNI